MSKRSKSPKKTRTKKKTVLKKKSTSKKKTVSKKRKNNNSSEVTSGYQATSPAKNPAEITGIKGKLRALKRDKKGRIKSNLSAERHLAGTEAQARKEKKKALIKGSRHLAETIPTVDSAMKLYDMKREIKKVLTPGKKGDRINGISNMTKQVMNDQVTSTIPEIDRAAKLARAAREGIRAARSYNRERKVTAVRSSIHYQTCGCGRQLRIERTKINGKCYVCEKSS